LGHASDLLSIVAGRRVTAAWFIRCTITVFRGDFNRMNHEIGDLSARSENEPQ